MLKEIKSIITDQINRHVAMTESHRAWLAKDIYRRLLPLVSELDRDKARIDFLEENNGLLKFEAEDDASLPHAAVYLPVFENGVSQWRHAASGDNFREAIDAAENTAGKIS